MHFAIPNRKESVYVRAPTRSPTNQPRRQLQLFGYFVLGLLTIYLFYRNLGWFSYSGSRIDDIQANPEIVIVTVFNDRMSEDYVRMITANRDDYAARHGYKNFYTNSTTYEDLVLPSPPTWSLLPALRYALTLYPSSTYLWSLSADALITNVTLSLESHILKRLPDLMIKDAPVVPPDSVIHTFSHIKPAQAHLILSQDMDNLAHTSFLLKNTPYIPGQPYDNWAHYFLDAWFDPLYRSYAFQKAEGHALEHLVQWHPTILAKLVLVPQRIINSYNFVSGPRLDEETGQTRKHDSMWQEGDLLVNFKGCLESKDRDCETEMRKYFEKWKKTVESIDGKAPQVQLGDHKIEVDKRPVVKSGAGAWMVTIT